MANDISLQAITLYLPIIKDIASSLELGYLKHSAVLEQKDDVMVGPLSGEYSPQQQGHSTIILSNWLRNTPFTIDHFSFRRTGNASWGTLVALLRDKIAEYDYDRAIDILISPSGKVSREVAGEVFSHDMEEGKMRIEIIKRLSEADDFVSTDQLRRAVRSKSSTSILKTIPKINGSLRLRLHLPAAHEFIDTKRGLGHRIHPAYNVIFLKKD